MQIGKVIKIGSLIFKSITKGIGTYKYSDNRISELKNKGYDDETIKKMMYFELGLSTVAGISLSTAAASGCAATGGAIGAEIGFIGGPPGAVIGAGIGILTGPVVCGFSIGATTSVISQKISEEIFSENPNPENEEIDLSKIKTYMYDNSATIKSIKKINDNVNQAQSTEKQVIIDPITFDLDGDGLETTSLENGIYFDQNNDGFMETTAWVAKDDGLLALDRNLNGSIDNGSELFGDNTKLSDGSTASDGYEALAQLDTNSDGKIDINDSEFSNLKILKGDGITMTMDEAGIKSIDLNHSETEITDDNGNEQTAIRKLAKCA